MLGIIGAMQVEVSTLKQCMTEQETRTISGMEFVKGRLDGREVVAVVCGEGKVAAAVCAQTLILVKRLAMKYYPDERLADEEIAASGKAVRMYEIEIEHMSGKEIQER